MLKVIEFFVQIKKIEHFSFLLLHNHTSKLWNILVWIVGITFLWEFLICVNFGKLLTIILQTVILITIKRNYKNCATEPDWYRFSLEWSFTIYTTKSNFNSDNIQSRKKEILRKSLTEKLRLKMHNRILRKLKQ